MLASVERMQRFPVPLQQNNNGLVGDVFVLGGGWCWRGRRKEGREEGRKTMIFEEGLKGQARHT